VLEKEISTAQQERGGVGFERAYAWLTLCRLIEHTKVPSYLALVFLFHWLGSFGLVRL
jgi:hypothetical protein